MEFSPVIWHPHRRREIDLRADCGVYAMFLRDGSVLRGLETAPGSPIYIGVGAGAKGLAGRCHFDARTYNHSPRKSLAVLLMDELELQPVLCRKRSGATWGLAEVSDLSLSSWMHDNLELAVEYCPDARDREKALIVVHAPPLNLSGCYQTEWHRQLSAARSSVREALLAEKPRGRSLGGAA